MADEDWSEKLAKNYERNKAYAKDDSYQTTLNPQMETAFRKWLKQSKVPFDPDAKVQDYDMRGFFKSLASGDSKAVTAINKEDGKIHYPDYWKTPYHATFSNESQWAIPGAPAWDKQDRLVTPSGQVVFDSRAAATPLQQPQPAAPLTTQQQPATQPVTPPMAQPDPLQAPQQAPRQ